MRRWPALVGVHLALVIVAVATLLPFLWMLSASLMPAGEASQWPPSFLPSRPTLANYRALFQRLDLGRCFLNSAFVAVVSTALALLVVSLAGYAFAKLRFPGRSRLFRTLLTAMVIPAQVAMLPLFLLLREVGLVNTYWGVIIPALAPVFGIFMVRQYALSLPDELLDAARVDGAGEFTIYRRLVLPLLRPILVTFGVFSFIGAWNDFMWPLIVLTDDRRYTLPVALANLIGEHAQDIELMMAGSVLTVLPVLLLFLVLQRTYVEGLTMGGVKE
ncbi:MAG: carbohydrate ABC transporter permease [Thermoanaerobaculaceae bacterium]|nr:carbohydrate ABC transporter permease [Thermoanaerobaculaceae bacterium]TAM56145.1 MAG: carbohydrate ABC transporter permease [Acidobacteriota bacterium]